ncbi:gallinacin-1 alpha-like [Melanerpes formicivorus]
MRILYLLFPLLLLLVQGAAGYCGYLKCSFPCVIKGECSRLFVCCKR